MAIIIQSKKSLQVDIKQCSHPNLIPPLMAFSNHVIANSTMGENPIFGEIMKYIMYLWFVYDIYGRRAFCTVWVLRSPSNNGMPWPK